MNLKAQLTLIAHKVTPPAILLLSQPPPGFSKVLKTLSAASTRDELLAFLQQYGSHYVSEALYGSELSCSIYFPSKKAQQQLWLQYQKGECRKWRLKPGCERFRGMLVDLSEQCSLFVFFVFFLT